MPVARPSALHHRSVAFGDRGLTFFATRKRQKLPSLREGSFTRHLSRLRRHQMSVARLRLATLAAFCKRKHQMARDAGRQADPRRIAPFEFAPSGCRLGAPSRADQGVLRTPWNPNGGASRRRILHGCGTRCLSAVVDRFGGRRPNRKEQVSRIAVGKPTRDAVRHLTLLSAAAARRRLRAAAKGAAHPWNPRAALRAAAYRTLRLITAIAVLA